MHSTKRTNTCGFTLIEVLVVLAVVAVISAIAIPGLIKLGAFSRDEFKRTVSQVDSVLRAAEIYATTYHVNTAVVYNMDHFEPAEVDGAAGVPIADPIIDSFTGAPVRQIEAAAIMYQLPASMGSVSNYYVPIPGELGEFQPFPPGMAILLQDPEHPVPVGVPTEYDPYYFQFGFSNYFADGANQNDIGAMGLNSVDVALGIPIGMSSADLIGFTGNLANYDVAPFMAHVFKPSGRLGVTDSVNECIGGNCSRERYTLYIAPSADRPLDERLVEPESTDLLDANGRSNLRYRKIYLHRATARTSVPDAY